MPKQSEKLKVIIVDDEEKSRKILQKLIEEYIENITVLAAVVDVLEAVKMIQKHEPDVVFLDIEMPGYSGFKLIEYFDEINFEIVFTTAYERYAVQAYKISAIGYLLKPIDIDELIDIFKKIEKKIIKKRAAENTEALLEELSNRIIFPTQSGLIYLKRDEICYLESLNRYTHVYLNNGEQMLTTLSLKDCCEKLSDSTFIRIHRSYVINLTYIQNYSRGRDSFVIMDNNEKVDVGLFYKDDLNRIIASFLK